MFHWWYIPIGLAVFFVLVIVGWLCSMRTNMPWQNCLAAMSNLRLKLNPGLRKFALSGVRDYSTLPDPLTMTDGTAVKTQAQFLERREEILNLFETYVYGIFPKSGFDISWEKVEEGDALQGRALRKQVKLTVTTPKGSSDALLLLYLPKTVKPAPVVLGLNFRGNHTVLEDPSILPSYSSDTSDGKWQEKRGSAAERWNIADCVSRGYAVGTMYSADWAPDGKDTYHTRVIGLFEEDEFKAIGAWAFGLMRGADYLMSDPAIDHAHIAVLGHSRLGKAAVWAGANDSRFGMVISNDSGNSGASLSRGNHGETVYTINKAFPYWFCSSYSQYGKRENELPVDQNLLLAAVAPRKLYVANAEGDLWADPQGAFNSLQSAKNAFSLYYGDEVLPDHMQTYPPIGQAYFCKSMGLHLRAGWHDVQAEDWKFYLDYMDRYFGKEERHG